MIWKRVVYVRLNAMTPVACYGHRTRSRVMCGILVLFAACGNRLSRQVRPGLHRRLPGVIKDPAYCKCARCLFPARCHIIRGSRLVWVTGRSLLSIIGHGTCCQLCCVWWSWTVIHAEASARNGIFVLRCGVWISLLTYLFTCIIFFTLCHRDR